MDVSAEFERIIAEMDGEEVLESTLSMLDEVLGGALSLAPPSPTPPPPPPAVPAEEGFGAFPQPADPLGGGYSGGVPLGAWPRGFEQPLMANPAPFMYQGPLYHHGVMQSGLLYGQAGAHTQGQHLPHDWPVHIVPGPAAAVAPPQPYDNFPQVMLPRGTNQNLAPVGTLTGAIAYGIPYRVPPLAPAAKPLNTTASKEGKCVSHQDDDRPYVKKPPNAFMLFRKEQRPNVVAELHVSECAVVNTVLGQRWKSLSAEERAKYYEEAHEEKLRHAEQFPEWSAKNNYGKKRKRVRSKAPPSAEASASNPEELTQRAKRLRVTRVEAAAAEPSASLIDTTEASHTQSGVMEAPDSWMDIMEASHTQSGVMEAPDSWMDIMEASHTQSGVMEAPDSWMDIMEASHTQSSVIGAPYTWTDTMEAPHTPPGVMEAPIAHNEVTEPNLWDVLHMLEMDLPAASASKCEETTQPAEETPLQTAATQPSASQAAMTGSPHAHAGTTGAPETEPVNDFFALLQMCRMDFPAASGPEPEEVTHTEPPTTHTGTVEAEPVNDILGLLKLCEMYSADSAAQRP